MKKVASLVGARPQFIKEAVLGARVQEMNAWKHVLIHSGQHYDACMSDVFFRELGIPKPMYSLGIGSASHATMTASIMVALEHVLEEERPDALLVYGDTNTTLAGGLVAAKMDIPVVHVEAGIRMLPANMPEEINRRLVDRLSSVLCCCSQLGVDNLQNEGITSGVDLTGDIMYDVFLRMKPIFTAMQAYAQFGVSPQSYAVATLHRNYNVDEKERLAAILDGLENIAKSGIDVLFPVHPRTGKKIEEFGLSPHLKLIPPVGYLELMSLVNNAAFVLTDSGGLQKESYYAGKRALVVMPDAGWKELVDTGWNILCPADADKIYENALMIKSPRAIPSQLYGDGHSADAIIASVSRYIA